MLELIVSKLFVAAYSNVRENSWKYYLQER